jgi:hypothetical protein
MRGRIFVSQTMEAFVSSCTIMAETRCLDSKSRKSCKHLSHVSEAFFFIDDRKNAHLRGWQGLIFSFEGAQVLILYLCTKSHKSWKYISSCDVTFFS